MDKNINCNMKITLLLFITFTTINLYSQQMHPFTGQWESIKDQSADIDLYGKISLDISGDNDRIQIIRKFGGRRYFGDTLDVQPGGKVSNVQINDRVFPSNVFMGLSMIPGTKRTLSAEWTDEGQTITIHETYQLQSSQGKSMQQNTHLINYDDVFNILHYQMIRSSRKDTIHYILKPAGERVAYYMPLQDNWKQDEQLPENAMMISLQGIVNKNGPRLYYLYPQSWDFTYTREVFDFYKNERYYTFNKLQSAEKALEIFREEIKGYIVWDKQVRTSIIVSFTLAGLKDAIVINEDMIPLMEKHGISLVYDFRDQFLDLTDAEIYQWAYNNYWDKCSRDYIIWMGGEHGNTMKPGVADWGIYQKAFFSDLSAKPEDKQEYKLACKLLEEMNPHSMVMGWHSYKKDKERDHVSLTSSYGHRVEGLHTLPNLSFSSQVKASKGFEYRNNHHLKPDSAYKAGKKVYVTCVQTDGIGLGAWTKPGRGEIPYAWELTMNYLWMAPAMLEFFYSQATPNDYFIGALSGPGYMYPKAVPEKLLPNLLQITDSMMKTLDLNVFEIMDYSEGATVEGNTELTKKVVELYYENIPSAIGFINGYAPAFTFIEKNGRALISYDYYLSPYRSEKEAVADLEELANINNKRPYYLLMHIREYSDIKRVKRILDQLSDEFELVPLDVFLHLAGKKATFETRLLDKE